MEFEGCGCRQWSLILGVLVERGASGALYDGSIMWAVELKRTFESLSWLPRVTVLSSVQLELDYTGLGVSVTPLCVEP